MPPPNPNNTYTKPPLEIQILEFIKTLGYDEEPETKMIVVSKMDATRLHQPWRAILSVLNRCLMGKDSSWDTFILIILQILWGIIHYANLDFASLTWDEFDWQTVKRSSGPSKMSKLFSQDDQPITKLLSKTNGDYKFGMEVPDAMISDEIKKKTGYKFYMAKKVESEKAKIVDEPKVQHVSPVKSRRGKGFMSYGDQVANVPNKLKKDVVPRKTRSLTIAKEAVVDTYAELESLKQKKQAVTGEGSSVVHKNYANSDTNSDATLYSSSLDESDDNLHKDDDAVGYGVFMHNKSTATPNSTYLMSLVGPAGDPGINQDVLIPLIGYDEDVHDLRSVKTEFPAIVFNDNLTSNETLSCEPTVSSLNNNEIDFRISFDKSDDEDYTVVFDKNSFSYKIFFTNDLKTDWENDNEKINMPLFPSYEPSVNCIDDLDFFKDFENEFPAIVYNDALTSKSDFSTKPILCSQHIDEFDLKDETSLSEYDEVEQNVLY
ncbi:hypothetical protein Tco_1268545, partial [Tanacetum coccineum]